MEFGGTSETSHPPKDCAGSAARACDASIVTKTSNVLPPSRPIAFTSVADATPVTISDTTSGITVIRIAFTQRAPIGATASAALRSGGRPLAAIDIPPAIAAPSATRTRVLFFIRSWPTSSDRRR